MSGGKPCEYHKKVPCGNLGEAVDFPDGTHYICDRGIQEWNSTHANKIFRKGFLPHEGETVAASGSARTSPRRIFVSMGMSLDGMIAGPNRGPANPLGDRGVEIHSWAYSQEVFRKNHDLGPGGETGTDNRILEAMLERTGANIMGKRMFEEGEPNWPEVAPFHAPVFVVTHEVREPWERKGGTTFYFVNDGIESALRQARNAAGDKDVRISGGANLALQYLNAGLVDELLIDLAPMFLGDGLRLFDGLDHRRLSLTIVEAVQSPWVTHLRYAVASKPSSPSQA